MTARRAKLVETIADLDEIIARRETLVQAAEYAVVSALSFLPDALDQARGYLHERRADLDRAVAFRAACQRELDGGAGIGMLQTELSTTAPHGAGGKIA